VDFVTHAAVGALTGRALSGDGGVGAQRRAARLGAAVALLPDTDHVLEFVSAEAYLVQHRTASHSLLAAVAVTLIAAAIPGARAQRAAIVACSLATHLLLDVLTPFGTGLTWPFSDARAALDGLPIVCPWLLIPALALACWARRRGNAGEPSRFAARAGLSVVLGICALGWCVARLGGDAVSRPTDGLHMAVPDWRSPFTTLVLTADDKTVHRYQVGLISGEPELLATSPRVGGAADWAAIGTAVTAGGVPLSRFRVPVADLSDDGTVFRDAQFDLLDPGRRVFSLTVAANPEPHVDMIHRGKQPFVVLAVFLAIFWLGRTPKGTAKAS
jgi:membrane-bound metal-dependent hydrolase YbcI (DUF457 family)